MGDFQRDEVLYFIISKGGRVRNHELVTHFKNFLDHPINKGDFFFQTQILMIDMCIIVECGKDACRY